MAFTKQGQGHIAVPGPGVPGRFQDLGLDPSLHAQGQEVLGEGDHPGLIVKDLKLRPEGDAPGVLHEILIPDDGVLDDVHPVLFPHVSLWTTGPLHLMITSGE